MTPPTFDTHKAIVGTAGWAIPRASASAFPAEGSGLERYAARFNGVEVNSTFYRSHRPATLERWRASTPEGFRFAVKAPKTITHEARLADCAPRMAQFFDEIAPLAEKLGPILVQLPPSLAFDAKVAGVFLASLRALWAGAVALEPRHASWFEADAEALLSAHGVARVAADPARASTAGQPGGYPGLAYWRLHGAPRLYYSPYGANALDAVAAAMTADRGRETWCIFDNTASGAAAANALTLAGALRRSPG